MLVRLRCALISTACLMSLTAVAQQSMEPTCTPGYMSWMNFGSSFKGVYTATVRTTSEQTLPDGSHVGGSATYQMARSEKGQTMQQQMVSCRVDIADKSHVSYTVSTYDPTTRTSMSWNVTPLQSEKVVHISHARSTSSHQLSSEERQLRAEEARLFQTPSSEWKKEDLGKRTIAGVEAQGTRNTRTIPAHREGNELPLTIIDERWVSQGGLVMLATSSDPRRGKYTYEVTELVSGEPDAALFTPPADYRVEDLDADKVAAQ